MSVTDDHKNLPETVFKISKSSSLKSIQPPTKKYIKSPHVANLGKLDGIKTYVDDLLEYRIQDFFI